jgi:hypothetical protein
MSTLATVNVLDDPGYRIVQATYRGLMYVTAGVNHFDLQLKVDGTLAQGHRWSPGSPAELNVCLSKVIYVGPGVHVLTVEFAWGSVSAGAETEVTTFGDPNFNILEYIVWPAGGI